MLRHAVLAFFLLFLAGCCSSGASERSHLCEEAWEASRAAAERGWENVRKGVAPQPHPTLHLGMAAGEAKKALGTPPRREESEEGERWTYPERGLVVFVEGGKVAGWKKKQ